MKEFKEKEFLKKIEGSKILDEVKKVLIIAILERIWSKQTQKEIAEKGLLSLSSVKKVELGECYDLKIINEYIKSI